MAHSFLTKKLFLGTAIAPLAIVLSGCSLASLPANYSPLEKQTVEELSGVNYVPRSDEEREAIATQDMFAQTAFWSREYDLNPADLEAAINLAANLRKMGNPSKSIEVAQHTRALYPRDVDLMTELGASLIANNDTNEAIKIIDSALYQRPRSARLWSLKGAAMDQQERFGEARQNYTKALGLAPNDPSILANVGLSYALEGDPQTAEIWLRRAATLPGANPNVRQNLALVLGLQGKLDEAEKWAKQDLNQEGAQQNLAYIRSLRGSSQPTAATSQPTTTTAASTTRSPRVYGQQTTPQKTQYSATASASPATQPTTTRTVKSPAPRQYAPQLAKFGAKLAVAGDPTKMQGGPQTVSEAALEALRQRNTALRNMPSTGATPQAQPTPSPAATSPTSVLNKISQNNAPKVTIAQHQQAQLAQRAAYAAQQRQQQAQMTQQQQQQQVRPPYPPQHVQRLPNGQMIVNGRPVPVPPGYKMAPQQQQYPNDARPPARSRRR